MRCYLRSLAGCLMALLAMGTVAQGELKLQDAITQNSGPVERAAGNGSMGMGEGIHNRPGKFEEDSHQPKRKYQPAANSDEASELRHGGNETDMEHKRRRTLGDGRD